MHIAKNCCAHPQDRPSATKQMSPKFFSRTVRGEILNEVRP